MRTPLSAKQCYALLEKHAIPITGYIPLESLFALIREANRLGADSDVIHVKYKKPKGSA